VGEHAVEAHRIQMLEPPHSRSTGRAQKQGESAILQAPRLIWELTSWGRRLSQ
jgi:hypothetical protein